MVWTADDISKLERTLAHALPASFAQQSDDRLEFIARVLRGELHVEQRATPAEVMLPPSSEIDALLHTLSAAATAALAMEDSSLLLCVAHHLKRPGHRGAPSTTVELPPALPTSMYFGAQTLLASVESGAISPLSGRWVASLFASRGDRLVRRQELPPEAFVSTAALRALVDSLGPDFGLAFVALSYRWLSRDHPDPNGFHLGIVGDVCRSYLGLDDSGEPGESFDSDKRSPLLAACAQHGVMRADFALFWDFGSLHQKPRSPSEQIAFEGGLKALPSWYGHQDTLCWVSANSSNPGLAQLTAHWSCVRTLVCGTQMQTRLPPGFGGLPYEASGWCYVESSMSACIKHGLRRLDLGLSGGVSPSTWGGSGAVSAYGSERIFDQYRLDVVCAADRPPPPTPAEVRRRLHDEKSFTNSSDASVVAQLYESFFEEATASATSLSFPRVGWGAAELRAFLEVLPAFGALTSLDLSYQPHDYTPNPGKLLAAALTAGRTPPNLAHVAVDGLSLPLDDLRGRIPTPAVDLSGHGQKLRDTSAYIIAAVLPTSPGAPLRSLDLTMSAIGEHAADAIADAVVACASLVTFGPIPIAALRADSLEELDLQNGTMMAAENASLARLLVRTARLRRLVLAFNGVDAHAARLFARALADGATGLRELDVRHNPLQDKGSDNVSARDELAQAAARGGAATAVKLLM